MFSGEKAAISKVVGAIVERDHSQPRVVSNKRKDKKRFVPDFHKNKFKTDRPDFIIFFFFLSTSTLSLSLFSRIASQIDPFSRGKYFPSPRIIRPRAKDRLPGVFCVRDSWRGEEIPGHHVTTLRRFLLIETGGARCQVALRRIVDRLFSSAIPPLPNA